VEKNDVTKPKRCSCGGSAAVFFRNTNILVPVDTVEIHRGICRR